jgi:hypothetical protein
VLRKAAYVRLAISEEPNLLIGVLVVNASARNGRGFFSGFFAAAFDTLFAPLCRASHKLYGKAGSPERPLRSFLWAKFPASASCRRRPVSPEEAGRDPHLVPGDAAPGDAAPGDAAPGDAAPGDQEIIGRSNRLPQSIAKRKRAVEKRR